MGCRRRDSRSALLRVVVRTAEDGSAVVVPDPGRVAQGRGASLHPTPTCFEQAVRKRAFGRALRTSAALDLSRLRDLVEGRTQEPPLQENRKRV